MSSAMAFVSHAILPSSHPSFSQALSKSPRRLSHPRTSRMTATPPEGQSTQVESPTQVKSPPAQPAAENYELDVDAWKDKAVNMFNDLGTRPLFYGKIAGYAVGGLVTITVLRAVVVAVDSIPVLPGALELIGLGYTAWFVWRYVLFKESREELLEEIEDFLGRAKPGKE